MQALDKLRHLPHEILFLSDVFGKVVEFPPTVFEKYNQLPDASGSASTLDARARQSVSFKMAQFSGFMEKLLAPAKEAFNVGP